MFLRHGTHSSRIAPISRPASRPHSAAATACTGAKRRAFVSTSRTTAPAALALARANWNVQREPADLRILVDAARAAGDAAALEIAAQWITSTRMENVAVASVAMVRK